MNKAEFIEKMVEKSGFTKKDATTAVESFIDIVGDAMVEGEKIQFVGFGNFEIGERAARKGKNPKTGEEIDIPASKTAKFKASKVLKERMNG